MARPVQTERNKKILEMYNQGMKQADIAKQVGLTVTSVSIILRSMPEYRRRGTGKRDKQCLRNPKIENINGAISKELQYFDMLDKFTDVVSQINNLAKEGESVQKIQKEMQKIAYVFLLLIE